MTAPSGVATGTYTSGTSIPYPGDTDAGQFAVLSIEAGHSSDVLPPSGWSDVPGSPYLSSAVPTASDSLIYEFYRWLDGTEGGSNVSISGTADHCSGYIRTYANVHPSSPINASGTDRESALSTAVNVSGVTTTRADCLVRVSVARSSDVSGPQFSGWANSNLTSRTEIVDNGTATGNGGGLALLEGVKETAGSVGATTATLSSVAKQAAIVLALAPAPTAYTLTATTATFTATGNAATVKSVRRMVASVASYAMTGGSVTYRLGRGVVAAAGTYVLSYGFVQFPGAAGITAEPGFYSLTGQSAVVKGARRMQAATASYAMSGQAAALGRVRGVLASPGSYAMSGHDAALIYETSMWGFVGADSAASWAFTQDI